MLTFLGAFARRKQMASPHCRERNKLVCTLLYFLGGIAAILAFSSELPLYAQSLPSGFAESRVAYPISSPTAMAFAPDGRLFVCQQGGQVRIIKNGDLLSTPFLTVTVDSIGERGLVGIAFDPGFPSNQFVYIYYIAKTPTVHARVSRFTANGDVAVSGSEVAIMELDDTPGGIHVGGAMNFGPDAKLYIATGENGVSSNAQTLANVKGKILRINTDGTIPADNPFYGSTTGRNRAIWALGLRNPYTFSFQPTVGRMFINDVGSGTWEEINDGIAGANYGWPTCEGFCFPSNSSYRDPLFAYGHGSSNTLGCAITGGAFYNPATPQFPSEYLGKYFFLDYCSAWIRMFDPATNSTGGFATGLAGFPVHLEVGPDGSLYYLSRSDDDGSAYATGNGAVYKIAYTGILAPQIGQHPSNETVASGGTATFVVRASGAAPLTYQWQKNGNDILGATSPRYTTPNVSMNDNGAQFSCRVTNNYGTAISNLATLTVTPNDAPVVTITAPVEGTLYSAGDTINYSGTSTDTEDGPLPPSAFTWKVDFQHNAHSHPFIPAISGETSGSFTIPTTGETDPNVWYRIYLTVKDSAGVSATTYRDIIPRTSTISLSTNPVGLQLTLDGQPHTTPYSTNGVIGITRTLGIISPQRLNGVTYEFDSWSDGRNATHDISTPTSGTTYTALFRPVDTNNYGASFVSQTVPTSMLAGQTYNVSITMANIGTNTWDVVNSYRLGSANPLDNLTWGASRVNLPGPVAPGSNVTINFVVTAPSTAGTYNFEWRMVQDGVAWFGELTPNVSITVSGAPANAATFVSQTVPTIMLAGQTYNVSVTMANAGTNTWEVVNSYRLGSANPLDNLTWGASRVNLPGPVAPGSNVTINFAVTAPSTAGTYNFQWRMVQDGVAWFGNLTSNVSITVSGALANAATFVSQTVPTSMLAGQTYNVSITLNNMGSSTWSSANNYRLGSANPLDNLTWGASRVNLPGPVAPGSNVTINFAVTAPSTAGTYNFQWRMVQDGVAWFGDFTPNLMPSVQSSTPPQITHQPLDTTVAEGQSATFSVTASGTAPLTYQWQRNGTNISGATSSTYTINSVSVADSGMQFRCVVANAAGSVTSSSATVRILPRITGQPSNQSVFVGQPATFSVTASGDAPLTYQWQRNGISISGATSSSYTIASVTAPDNGAAFRCMVTNPYGSAVSNTASLTVSVTITVSASPSGMQVTLDGVTQTTPVSFASAVGSIRTLGVMSPQTMNGTTYVFDSWSDNGAATHNIITPGTNTAYSVVYRVNGGSTGNGNGLSGVYYDNIDFTGSTSSRIDSFINFDWGVGSPVTGINPGTFSVRWTGQMQAQFSEMYTFYTQSSDGVRLWVDGKLIIDNWTDHAISENSARVRLKAGQKYAIRLDFYKRIGNATARLLWSSQNSTPKSVIPKSQLYSP